MYNKTKGHFIGGAIYKLLYNGFTGLAHLRKIGLYAAHELK